jgi:uncharacterized membrane protein
MSRTKFMLNALFFWDSWNAPEGAGTWAEGHPLRHFLDLTPVRFAHGSDGRPGRPAGSRPCERSASFLISRQFASLTAPMGRPDRPAGSRPRERSAFELATSLSASAAFFAAITGMAEFLVLREERRLSRLTATAWKTTGCPSRKTTEWSVKGVVMSDLVVIVYPSEEKALEVRQRLFELQKEYLVKIGDAVVATKDDSGRVKLNQILNTTAAGAAAGSFWGLLIGVLFLNPLLGVAAGAASGALGGALTDVGIEDKFMKKLAESIEPGSAALFVLVQEMTTDKVLAAIKDFGGVVLKTSFDETKEQVLRDALKSANPS